MIDDNKYYIKISPGVLSGDTISKTYSGNTFGVYSGMSQILSGGTGGSSLLTGLTIPILFTQDYDDMGYFTPFDGYILQKDVVTNFLISGSSTNNYSIMLYNTSDEIKKFLKIANYNIDWGDGQTETFTPTTTQPLEHIYSVVTSAYTVTMTQTNMWGITEIKKDVYVPHSGVTISNPLGIITFIPQGGNWSGIPINYEYIFTGDSENIVAKQTSDNFTTIPFIVSGFTESRLKELKLYGQVEYDPSKLIQKNGIDYGRVTEITSGYTAYTIDNVDYYDYSGNTTLFVVNSSGLTTNSMVASGITKEEVLFGVIDSPEIQSEIFIQRGVVSPFEGLQRLGEVDNMGDLENYGYGFFKINKI